MIFTHFFYQQRIPFFQVRILFLFILATALFSQMAQASQTIKVQIRDDNGKPIKQEELYRGSYALLIGASNYTAGWPSLESIPGELSKVKQLLKKKGFIVEYHLDPDHKKIRKLFNDFINRYGFDRENRLLFFFSGHGHTRKNGSKGYLVPVDAPNPNIDDKGFLRKALEMQQILTWSKKIEAKHALFLFDSCFSGTIFQQKQLLSPPKHIKIIATEPVRQFITAGSAGEPVPARSTFTPAFVDGLKHSLADLNGDHYISGTELGAYLQKKVSEFTQQHPQFGKSKDYELARGDFIFLAGGSVADPPSDSPVPPPSPQKKPEFGSLKITSVPSNSTVKVNGKPAGQTPVELDGIPPGTMRITVTKSGYQKKEQLIQIKKGRKASVNFNLSKKQEYGRLTVLTNPNNAKVRIENIAKKYSPNVKLSPGRYHISVSAAGYTAEKRWVDLSSGSSLTVSFRLNQEKRSMYGSLKITSSPSGSPVQVNGKSAGQTPLSLEQMSPGEVLVSVSKNGYVSKKQRITIRQGRKSSLKFDLERQQKNGRLTVLIKPDNARVRLMNTESKYSPGMELPPGEYHIKVSASGHTPEKRVVKLTSGSSLTVSFHLERKQTNTLLSRNNAKRSSPPRVKEVKRDGRFIAYADETVRDTKTGLMWAARDNGQDINWRDAKAYCENFQGGGYTDWRTPSEKELADLYKAKISPKEKPGNHIIELTKGYVWTSEKRGNKAAFFYFDEGLKLWYTQSNFFYLRALPVRRAH